jgi:hypothetical protein
MDDRKKKSLLFSTCGVVWCGVVLQIVPGQHTSQNNMDNDKTLRNSYETDSKIKGISKLMKGD